MCALFKNRYVIGSKRYQGFDYSSHGKYFITICTKNREQYFGKIENGVMFLSELGKLLQNEWLKTPDIRPDMNIILDEFVIMPDHFHAIIIIGENQYNQNKIQAHRGNVMHDVSTTNQNNNYHNEFGPQLKNLSSVIRGIKSVETVNEKNQNRIFNGNPDSMII